MRAQFQPTVIGPAEAVVKIRSEEEVPKTREIEAQRQGI